MILSCPECGTQYTLKESQLGPRGRTVRCTTCRHTWHAEVPIDLRFSEPKKAVEPEEDLQSVKAKKLPGKYRAMLEDKKRMRALAVETVMWGGMAALAIVVLALGYFLRVDVVKAFPRVAGAYAMIGLDVKGTNLRFDSQTAAPVLKGGRFFVTVQAKVTNIGDKAEPVPPVRVKLQDGSLQPFGSVLIPSGGLVVEPHATRTLTFDIADPENKVAHLDLDFDLEAMKKGKKGQKSHKPAAGGHDEHATAGSEGESLATETPEAHGETPAEAAPHAEAAAVHGTNPTAEHGADHGPEHGPEHAPEHGAEAMAAPPEVTTQTFETDPQPHSLSRKPAHPLRGALSFGDDNAPATKTGHPASKS